MAKRIFAKTSGGGGDGLMPSSKRRTQAGLGIALAALVVIAVLVLPAIVFASGGPSTPTVIVTPSSGPVHTNVSVNGTHFKAGDKIVVGFSSGDCSSGVTTIPGAAGTVGSNGTFIIPFVWPDTPKGSYVVCAMDQTNGHSYKSAQPFQVLGTDPPTITINGPVQAGQPVQVSGKNFLPGGGTVEILYGPDGSNGCANSQGTADVGDDGSFTFTFNAPFTSSDETIVVTGVEPQGSCGGSPVLQASANVQVTAAAPATPTPAPTATTAAPTATPGGGIGGIVVWPPSGPWTVVYCLIGLLALLLLLLLLLLLARRRRKDEPEVIREQDRVVVAPNAAGATGAGQGGQATVQRDVYAENPRTGQRTPIAEEVTSVQEEYLDNPPSGQGGQP